MIRLIPVGFLDIREAAERLAIALYSGIPEPRAVLRNRQAGYDVTDGQARDHAIAELWAAVDRSAVQAFLLGTKGEPFRMPPAMSEGVPSLRSPRGGDLTFLRPRNPYYRQIVALFGTDLSSISVAFMKIDVDKLARNLVRRRRRKNVNSNEKKRGRPSRSPELKKIISSLVDQGRWSAVEPVKALTQKVNRVSKGAEPFSEDSVERAVKQLHDETSDRRFGRIRKRES
jgi:hypothetical protein